MCCTMRRRSLDECEEGEFMAPEAQSPLTRIARAGKMLTALEFKWGNPFCWYKTLSFPASTDSKRDSAISPCVIHCRSLLTMLK